MNHNVTAREVTVTIDAEKAFLVDFVKMPVLLDIMIVLTNVEAIK